MKGAYPENHKPGMEVPRGGSMCANCEYLKNRNKGYCGNKYFVAWNGSAKIPGNINEYCSDWYEPAKEPSTKTDIGSEQRPARYSS